MGWIDGYRKKNQELYEKFKQNHPNYNELIQIHWKEQKEGIPKYLKIVSGIFLPTLLFPLLGLIYSRILAFLLLLIPLIVVIYVIYRIMYILQALETFYSSEEAIILHKSAFGKSNVQSWDRSEFDHIVAIMHGKASGNPRWEFLLGIGEEPEQNLANYFFTVPSHQSIKGNEFTQKLLDNQYSLMIIPYDVTTLCGKCITYLDEFRKNTDVSCSQCNTLIEFR